MLSLGLYTFHKWGCKELLELVKGHNCVLRFTPIVFLGSKGSTDQLQLIQPQQHGSCEIPSHGTSIDMPYTHIYIYIYSLCINQIYVYIYIYVMYISCKWYVYVMYMLWICSVYVMYILCICYVKYSIYIYIQICYVKKIICKYIVYMLCIYYVYTM